MPRPHPRVAIGPQPAGFAVDAARAGGGEVVELGDPADALIWLSPYDVGRLREVLAGQPEVAWVQLPFAGVEDAFDAGVVDDRRAWTCAKGSFAQPVAEHALLLALAGLRVLPERIRATTWGRPAGTTLHGARVTIVGAGGITAELLRLLGPFSVDATVVRRRPGEVPGATRTMPVERLDDALSGAQVVFLALALTPSTIGLIDGRRLALMGASCWLVNVARGRHVVTPELVDALRRGVIAGAALDVTEPEPLPDGHPLWTLPNCIVTPHTADTWDMIMPLLGARIEENVARFAAGEPLVGMVDPMAGY